MSGNDLLRRLCRYTCVGALLVDDEADSRPDELAVDECAVRDHMVSPARVRTNRHADVRAVSAFLAGPGALTDAA